MKLIDLKIELTRAAEIYAHERGFLVDSSWESATIFQKLSDNFCPESFQAFQSNEDWSSRTKKVHNQVTGALEMQSSNSSDALLMNIFCHPKIGSWKGIRDLLQIEQISPKFGVKPGVEKHGTQGDETEIDMEMGDFFVEAKLTEEGFKQKSITEVEKYTHFQKHFHLEDLRRREGKYENYQVIRNLLAAIQHEKRHALFCDERRPDLVRAYMETVSCLKDVSHRSRCHVIFWQEIARVCGKGLRNFLQEKYGIH